MEHVIQHVLIRILLYLVHYHQSPYHTVIFVHHQIVQHQIVMNIDATMPTSIIMISKFDNCILKAFDFRALQIEHLVCACAFNFLLTLSMLYFSFSLCVCFFFLFYVCYFFRYLFVVHG